MVDARWTLALSIAALLMLQAWRRTEARAWIGAFLATLVLFLGLQNLPPMLPGERLFGERWNWAGQLLALAGGLGIAWLMVRRAGLPWPAMGFTWRQRPHSWRAALGVSAVALSLNVLLIHQSSFRLHEVPLETWLYQATLPGLVEESLFRGVLLALLDRAFAARRLVFAAPVGWGGVVISAVFVTLHGVTPGALLAVLPASLLYLWLRARTGSLVAPILVHNLWNLSVYVAHL
jgi:membrane protease YdiL (CAAX protease family)